MENGKLKVKNLPDGWQTIKIKYISTCNNETLGEETPDDFEIKYIDIGSVTNGKGIENIQDFYFKTAPSRARRVVHTDDVIISTVRTYLKAIASIPKEYDNYICSTGFAVITPNEKIHHRFMQYALESDDFISNVEKYSVGISYPAINAEELINFKIFLPPQEQQKKIADFLDSKCSELQSAIDNTKQTIEEYKKLKQAVITKAVTKGLEPNRKMKNSGIEWIGQIPEEWEIVRLKSYFTYGKGLPITKADLVDDGIPVISYGQIHSKTNSGVRVDKTLIRYVSNDFLKSNPQSLVNEGDFILADTSEDTEGCGNCVYVDSQKELFAGYHTIILRSEKSKENKYHGYLFQSDAFRSQIRSKCDGVKLFSITRSILNTVNLILPSPSEQSEIVEYLDRKCSQIDTLISQKEQFISELEKYKQSLIYEYVTGKKEVK